MAFLRSASAPAPASVGCSLPLFDGKNIGGASANADWLDAIFLSSDASFDYNVTYVSAISAEDVSALAPGASSIFSTTVSVNTRGQFYLIFIAEVAVNQDEVSKSNNSIALPVILDLVGPDQQLFSPSARAAASIGSALNLSWTVKTSLLPPPMPTGEMPSISRTMQGDDYNDLQIDSFFVEDLSPLAAGVIYTLSRSISTSGLGVTG